MEEQCSPLSWAYYYQEEGVEGLKHSLLFSTLELEAAVISAHEEISRKDDEILQLKELVAKVIKERDEFQAKCQQLVMEKQLLFQQVQIQKTDSTTSNEDDNIDLSHSDTDDNIVTASPALPLTDKISVKKPLPEQGKFLQAVMEAGPLLQTLLLAGPLPQWQHPPPQLNSVDIPPVTILHQDSCLISPTSSGGFTNKRATMVTSDFSPKYQKVCSPIIIDPNIIH